jgi:FMN phosphatase YigB (HAD superfamily)
MATEDWQPSVEHDLLETLDMLQQRRVSLVAMTNSPAATTADVLERLGLAEVFPVVIASAQKPAGLARFIAEHGPACRYLAVGDHYVNDIEPVLEAGGRALYIDRHRTGLGAGHPKLERVRSIREVPARLWADFDWPGRA